MLLTSSSIQLLLDVKKANVDPSILLLLETACRENLRAHLF